MIINIDYKYMIININSYDYNLIFINESKIGIRQPITLSRDSPRRR